MCHGKKYSEKGCFVKVLEIDPKHRNAWHNLGCEGGGKVKGKKYSNKECYDNVQAQSKSN